MKLSRDTLQNLPYFWNEKTFKIYKQFQFQSCLEWKKGENISLFGFSYSQNMVKFEVFRITISLNINLWFLNSDTYSSMMIVKRIFFQNRR